MRTAPTPASDDQYLDRIRAGAEPDKGDQVGQLLAMLRDRGEDDR